MEQELLYVNYLYLHDPEEQLQPVFALHVLFFFTNRKTNNAKANNNNPHFQKPKPIPTIPANPVMPIMGNAQQSAHKPTTPIPANNFFKETPP